MEKLDNKRGVITRAQAVEQMDLLAGELWGDREQPKKAYKQANGFSPKVAAGVAIGLAYACDLLEEPYEDFEERMDDLMRYIKYHFNMPSFDDVMGYDAPAELDALVASLRGE